MNPLYVPRAGMARLYDAHTQSLRTWSVIMYLGLRQACLCAGTAGARTWRTWRRACWAPARQPPRSWMLPRRSRTAQGVRALARHLTSCFLAAGSLRLEPRSCTYPGELLLAGDAAQATWLVHGSKSLAKRPRIYWWHDVHPRTCLCRRVHPCSPPDLPGGHAGALVAQHRRALAEDSDGEDAAAPAAAHPMRAGSGMQPSVNDHAPVQQSAARPPMVLPAPRHVAGAANGAAAGSVEGDADQGTPPGERGSGPACSSAAAQAAALVDVRSGGGPAGASPSAGGHTTIRTQALTARRRRFDAPGSSGGGTEHDAREQLDPRLANGIDGHLPEPGTVPGGSSSRSSERGSSEDMDGGGSLPSSEEEMDDTDDGEESSEEVSEGKNIHSSVLQIHTYPINAWLGCKRLQGELSGVCAA